MTDPDGTIRTLRAGAAETYEWYCSGLASAGARGRSPLIRPAHEIPVLLRSQPDPVPWRQIVDSVRWVAEKRHEELSRRSLDQAMRGRPPDRVSGRWLLYDPRGADFSGLAACDRNAVFDEADCPGWDAWVCVIRDESINNDMFTSALACWIPDEYIDDYERGMSYMTGNAAAWADAPGAEALFPAKMIRQAGLMTR